ncbi:hypothetical protein DVU_2391 [Nitratidesulfovibrio vulgaris str. Hildenborough]|uniref:Uncharacterized protein n=1 Tax=Nitratidesulfovibrio vulgaris (strain ATCC 29579 / DSM 644 / CCUG 34227 / NCIMB 8303 / VKM B-1760 / Hildenborough) TaxID=882 RepID=Q729G0_NITV2|nr:hypothetical protein DVU_2391 [Nitratidesulfovibrio vulgaris str. Hildenborough]
MHERCCESKMTMADYTAAHGHFCLNIPILFCVRRGCNLTVELHLWIA